MARLSHCATVSLLPCLLGLLLLCPPAHGTDGAGEIERVAVPQWVPSDAFAPVVGTEGVGEAGSWTYFVPTPYWHPIHLQWPEGDAGAFLSSNHAGWAGVACLVGMIVLWYLGRERPGADRRSLGRMPQGIDDGRALSDEGPQTDVGFW